MKWILIVTILSGVGAPISVASIEFESRAACSEAMGSWPISYRPGGPDYSNRLDMRCVPKGRAR